MRVRFIGQMPAQGYSGGRLAALTQAEGLAMNGCTVDFLVDTIPEMAADFSTFSQVPLIQVDPSHLSAQVDHAIDVVIVVPSTGLVSQHAEWARHAVECRAKLVLMNFETPNWFNAVSPYKRSPERWTGWNIVAEFADMVLSISGEGSRYAAQYFRQAPDYCQFDFVWPGINTILADQAPAATTRDKTIVLLSRADRHKGFDQLDPLLTPELSEYKIIFIVGSVDTSLRRLERLRQRLARFSIQLEVQQNLPTIEKFRLLKQASLLYFPSRFEGFGIPPLEAAYCYLPVACSDLPVLREFGGAAFAYGDPTDVGNMRQAVLTALTMQDSVAAEHERMSDIARIESYGAKTRVKLEGLF
ncbi:MAG: glycosyltransferase family 4 protein [Chloroflexi bacterium]|nr:glycosyltransferase family 4 protein [Chloroflexota bacterium]